jgi:hypothetical protein
MSQQRKIALFAAILATAVLVLSATAGAATDPRKCSTVSAIPAHHAYDCARAAAKVATQTKLSKITGTRASWMTGVDCKQNPSLLKWRCQYPTSGKLYTALVTFRATSAGWRVSVTVTVAP